MISSPIPNPVFMMPGELYSGYAVLPAPLFPTLEKLRAESSSSLSFDPNENKRIRTSIEINNRSTVVRDIFSTLDREVITKAIEWIGPTIAHTAREQFLYYGKDSYANLHIDDQHPAPETQGKTKYVMHLLNQVGAIIYVCSPDLDGGELEFPSQEKVITPKTGTVVIYPSNYKYPHRVRPIKNGHRYAFVKHYYFYDTPAA